MSTTFVVSLGSNAIKIGLAGEDAPREVQIPVRGRMKDGNEENFPLTHNAWGRGMTNPRVAKKYSIEDVMVRPEGMGTIHSYEGVAAMVASYCAGVDRVGDAAKEIKGDTLIMSADSIAGNRSQMAKLAEMMFEGVGIGALYCNDDAPFALYGNGQTCGTVLDIGHGGTRVTPVNDANFVIRSDGIAQRSPVGGATQSMLMHHLLSKDAGLAKMGITFDAAADMDNINDVNYFTPPMLEDVKMFRSACFPGVGGSGAETITDEEYDLPDDRTVILTKEIRAACGEVLFNPDSFTPPTATSIVATGVPRTSPLHLLDQYQQAVKKAAPEINKDLSYLLDSPVVVCGGATRTTNFQKRFEAEVAAKPSLSAFQGGFKFAEDRMYSTFIGASIMGTLDGLSTMVATREAYEEYGSSVSMMWGYPGAEKEE